MGWETGRFPRMLRNMRNASNMVIDVGIVNPRTHREGESVAQIYMYHDEGTRRSPKRETLRPAIKDKKPHKEVARKIVRGTVLGSHRSEAVEGGEILAKRVRLEIMRLKRPPLKASTIRRRRNGGTNPLVDTGLMIRSIGSKVN